MSAAAINQSLDEKAKKRGANIFSRRDSVAHAGVQLQEEGYERLAELRAIWDEVGMTEDQRRDRMNTALDHVRSLLREMVEEEICMRNTLRNSLVNTKLEVETLLTELNMARPAFLLESEITYTLLEMEEKCRTFKETLVEERDLRVSDLKHLAAESEKYRDRIGLSAFAVDKSSVPDRDTLAKLRQDVDSVKQTWEQNLETYETKRSSILDFVDKIQIDLTSLTLFQRSVLSRVDLRTSTLVLSTHNMNELTELESMVQGKYNAYLNNIRRRIRVVQEELTKWWDQCHVPAAERDRFTTVDPEKDVEGAVTAYEQAITHWRSYYESRKAVLEMIGQWEALWWQQVDLEERERDTNRYNNRGGALLAEEKKRKKVQAALSQVYKTLSNLVAEYDSSHPGEPFMIDGVLVMDHIRKIELDYHEKKKKEKEQKDTMKRQQIITERIYGVSVNTPASQRKQAAGGSGSVTPTKQGQLKNTMSGTGQAKMNAPPTVAAGLAVTRSPKPKFVAPQRQQTDSQVSSSSVGKPPSGLPPSRLPKRKALDDQQNWSVDAGESQQHAIDISAGTAGETRSTTSNSYGEFATAVRSKGLDGQSTFINGGPSKFSRAL